MEESRVSHAANKILFITKRQELLITDDEQDKVIDTLFEEERQAFTDKIRASLQEEADYFEQATNHFQDHLQELLNLKFQSFPADAEWLPSPVITSGPSLKDISIKELKSKGIEVVYTKNGIQLKEPKPKDKSKRKPEDRDDAEQEVGGNDSNMSKDSVPVPSDDKSAASVDVNGGSESAKQLRKRRKT